MIEAERRADQQPRIEVGCLDAACLELSRQRAPGRFNRQAGERVVHVHSALPCSASSFA